MVDLPWVIGTSTLTISIRNYSSFIVLDAVVDVKRHCYSSMTN
jgi:hypothetical protein